MRIFRDRGGWSDTTATVMILVTILVCGVIPCLIGALR